MSPIVKRLKMGKAPGPEGIINGMLIKYGRNKMVEVCVLLLIGDGVQVLAR